MRSPSKSPQVIVFSLASGRCQCALSGCLHPNGGLGAVRHRRWLRCRRELAFWDGGWVDPYPVSRGGPLVPDKEYPTPRSLRM